MEARAGAETGQEMGTIWAERAQERREKRKKGKLRWWIRLMGVLAGGRLNLKKEGEMKKGWAECCNWGRAIEEKI